MPQEIICCGRAKADARSPHVKLVGSKKHVDPEVVRPEQDGGSDAPQTNSLERRGFRYLLAVAGVPSFFSGQITYFAPCHEEHEALCICTGFTRYSLLLN